MNRDLDYVLNYMVKYTKDRFMQDSEPMLNSQDIELVLNHIYELEQRIDRIKNIYISMQFAAPENMYIFIEKLGYVLEGEDNETNDI